MTTSPPLLDKLTAPPIIVTNPEVIKYLICQLFTEAILVLTLVLLIPSILWEEYRHYFGSGKDNKKKNNKNRGDNTKVKKEKKRGYVVPDSELELEKNIMNQQ